MEKTMNTPEDLSALASISVTVRVCHQIDGEHGESTFSKDVICDGLSWENEIIWQTACAIAEQQGHQTTVEALEAVTEKLKGQ